MAAANLEKSIPEELMEGIRPKNFKNEIAFREGCNFVLKLLEAY